MDIFKGNNTSKESLDKKIEPITKAVVVKKESEFMKMKRQFFTEDARSVKGHLIQNVIIPGIQRLISDAVKSGIDWFIYGVRGSSPSGARNVSYSNYYDRTKPPSIPNSNYNKPNAYSINDVTFTDRGEAEGVLMQMRDVIVKYGMASIADFYDMIYQKHTFTDNKYGWRDLKDADIFRVRDGYSIRFPKITALE